MANQNHHFLITEAMLKRAQTAEVKLEWFGLLKDFVR